MHQILKKLKSFLFMNGLIDDYCYIFLLRYEIPFNYLIKVRFKANFGFLNFE